MAKKKFDPKVVDSTILDFWSNLAYMPTEYKERRLWMAQSLYATKLRAQPFQDPLKAAVYRNTDKGILDTQMYKNLFDPLTKDGGGGKAEYVNADFKAFPADQHLKNIVEAKARSVIGDFIIEISDPVTKLQDQKEAEKIILQNKVRDIINDINKDLGNPPISMSQDPYKYMEAQTNKGDNKKAEHQLDAVGGIVEQLKLKIKDEKGLRIFMQYLYKNGIEIAFETAIRFYLVQQNQWQKKWGNYFFTDIRHFNKYSGEWTTDETTGRGRVGYIPVENLFTLPFKDKNGDDILAYFYELPETWANFERLVGAELSDEEKQKLLKLQKERGNVAYGYNYQSNTWANDNFKNDYSITVGRFAVCTQEANAFAEKYINGDIPTLESKPLDYLSEESPNDSKTVRCYNVWFTSYYIPINPSSYTRNSPAEWTLQSNYIYKIEKVKDMYRYGVDGRYAKPPLVIGFDSNKLSFTDVMEAFMPKIHHLWHQFQNYSSQDMKATFYDKRLFASMLSVLDDANKTQNAEPGQNTGKSGDAVVDSWKMAAQSGKGFLNFTDKNGNLILDPTKIIHTVDNELMKKATECLVLIGGLYNEMTRALAISDVGEGLIPKPRTTLGSIDQAMQSSSDARWAIEQMYDDCFISYSERVVQWVRDVCEEKDKYGYTQRWDELNDVIGMANGATLESISKIPLANIGMSIQREDTSAKRDLIIKQATDRLNGGALGESTWGLILDIKNWKLAVVILAMDEMDRKEEEQQQAEVAHQRQMELGQQQVQIQQAILQEKAKTDIVKDNAAAQNIAALQQHLTEIKGMMQQQLSDKRTKNKLVENAQKSELQKEVKSHIADLDAQLAEEK